MSVNSSWRIPATGIAVLLSGVFYYWGARGVLPGIFGVWTPGHPVPPADLGALSQVLPSLLFGLALPLIHSATVRRPVALPWFWLLVGAGWEILQAVVPALGTADLMDVAANFLGAVVAAHLLKASKPAGWRPLSPLHHLTVLGLGMVCLTGSSAPGHAVYRYAPQYMSYDELRSAFKVEPARAIGRTGKIYQVDKYLLVSEPNVGIHVFDNSDPKAPAGVAFLNLPGNIDLAVKDDILYADSYVDLVAIRFDGTTATEVHRVENAFPWNAYQNILNEDVYFSERDLDETRGVVVGYADKESAVARKRKGASNE